jgi:hypothetical protein
MKPSQNMKALMYYSTHGEITDPGEYGHLFEELPMNIRDLCKIVQGLIIHDMWLTRYGVDVERTRVKKELKLFFVKERIKRILDLDNQPLSKERSLDRHIIGCCRDYSVVLCSILRQKGVPARARCGFAKYFSPPYYFEDHWICEYWYAEQKRWFKVDPQIDDYQRDYLHINFDTCDIPENEFIVAGKAWDMCRNEDYDPQRFGLNDVHGLWFIRGNLVRDLASLNKFETVPYLVGTSWDSWEIMNPDCQLNDLQRDVLDDVASLTQTPDQAFNQIIKIYIKHAFLRPKGNWKIK